MFFAFDSILVGINRSHPSQRDRNHRSLAMEQSLAGMLTTFGGKTHSCQGVTFPYLEGGVCQVPRTGTGMDTVFGFVGTDYALLVADQDVARSIMVLSSEREKIKRIDDHKVG